MHVQPRPAAGPDLEPAGRELRASGGGEVVVRVEACGVCHRDDFSAQIAASYPIVLGHEIAGPVVETVPRADAPRAGERMLSGPARFRVVLTNP